MSDAKQYLTFGVDREQFALAVERVHEILDPRPISRVPHAPEYVLGLMDVRNATLLVIDLRTKFGFDKAEMTSRTRVIVVDAKIGSKDVSLGLMTDCVYEVTDLGGRPLDPSPEIGARWQADFIVGVGRQNTSFVLVLDLDRLLNQDDLLSPSLKVA